MNDDIEQLLRSLHLSKIAEIFDAEVAKAEKKESSYQDLVATLLRAQWHHRQETALSYRIRRSGMPEQWSLESFPWKRQPGVSQRQIRGFAELDFIAKAENIVPSRPTSSSSSWRSATGGRPPSSPPTSTSTSGTTVRSPFSGSAGPQDDVRHARWAGGVQDQAREHSEGLGASRGQAPSLRRHPHPADANSGDREDSARLCGQVIEQHRGVDRSDWTGRSGGELAGQGGCHMPAPHDGAGSRPSHGDEVLGDGGRCGALFECSPTGVVLGIGSQRALQRGSEARHVDHQGRLFADALGTGAGMLGRPTLVQSRPDGAVGAGGREAKRQEGRDHRSRQKDVRDHVRHLAGWLDAPPARPTRALSKPPSRRLEPGFSADQFRSGARRPRRLGKQQLSRGGDRGSDGEARQARRAQDGDLV